MLSSESERLNSSSFNLLFTVNQAFPVNWIWWVTLIIANGLLSLLSEVAIYFLIDLRDIQLDN